jgi:hypothetical protein
MPDAKSTTDHQKIRSWVEERGGKPAAVKGSGSDDDPGILRIDFPGYAGEEPLTEISWEQFFDKFEKQKLAFLFEEEMERGNVSRFSKLINHDSLDQSVQKKRVGQA